MYISFIRSNATKYANMERGIQLNAVFGNLAFREIQRRKSGFGKCFCPGHKIRDAR